jgi:hypothetical protein
MTRDVGMVGRAEQEKYMPTTSNVVAERKELVEII